MSKSMIASLAYTQSVCIAPSNVLRLLRQPKFYIACAISTPCGVIAALLKWIQNHTDWGSTLTVGWIKSSSVQSTLLFLVVLMASFRVDAAYSKFWTGCDYVYNIVGDLYDGSSDMIAFTRRSKADPQAVQDFLQLYVRLISLFNALIFAELESGSQRSNTGELPSTYHFELLDVNAFDDDSLDRLLSAEHKVEVVYSWIQFHLVEGVLNGIFSAPPPIVARGIKDISGALVHFHEAQKITEVPYPFPYMVALQLLMITHWLMAPIVAAQWTNYWPWTFGIAFVGTFSLWFFVGVAQDLDQPFQHTQNSVDMRYMQRLLNHRLLTILDQAAGPVPSLVNATSDKKRSRPSTMESWHGSPPLAEGWNDLSAALRRLPKRE